MKIVLIFTFSLLSLGAFSQSTLQSQDIDAQLHELRDQYQLNEDQVTEVKLILLERQSKMDEVEGLKSDVNAYSTERLKINKNYHESLNAVLSAEQIAKHQAAQRAARLHFSKQAKKNGTSKLSGGSSSSVKTTKNN